MGTSNVFFKSSPIITDVNLVFTYTATQSQYPMIRTIPRLHNGLVFFLEGSEHFYGKEINLFSSENSICFIPKGTNYNIDSDSNFTRSICIDFDILNQTHFEPFVITPKDTDKFIKLFTELERAFQTSDTTSITVLYKLYALLNALQKSSDVTYKPSWQTDRMLKAERYIRENLSNQNVSVQEIASFVNLSTRYFSEAFKNQFSETPINYIIRLRINLAKQLLDNSFHSVSKIAEICGYNDIYCFCKAFKKNTGMTTSEYIHRNTSVSENRNPS